MADVFGATVGALQMVGQLVSCINELQNLYRSMKNVPEDLRSTLKEIATIELILSQVRSFDLSYASPEACSSLQASLENCQAAASALEKLAARAVLPLNTQNKLRPKHLLQAVFKKKEIKELKEKLESAKSNLALAASSYQTMLSHELLTTTEQIHVILSSFTSIAPLDEAEFPLVKSKKKLSLNNRTQLYHARLCAVERCCCACHDTTTIQARSWMRLEFSSWNRCNKASCRNSKNANLWFSLTQIGIPLAGSLSLTFVLGSQQLHTTLSFRSNLDFPRVVRRTSPGFKLLYDAQHMDGKDWPEVKRDLIELFDLGKASPKDVDPDGNTWLEKLLYAPWCIGKRDIQFSMFDMLVELGTQINTKSLLYRSVNWIGEGPHMVLLEELIRSGFDVSEIEAPSFAMWPLPCSPGWLALNITPDPFFVDWISKNLENCPGFAGMNPLLEAILTGSGEKVKRLATKELLVKDQDNLLGQSALHLAVFRPQHLEILLEAGADVNSRDRHGTTPLMYAVAMGNSPVAIRLLDMGADPYLKDHHLKGNFLVYARERRHWTTVVDVLRHIHEDSEIPKHVSRYWSTLAVILLVNDGPTWYKDAGHFQALLDIGADANIVYQTGNCNLSTRTLAHDIWDKACLEALISHGFRSFNHQDGDGAHALISLSRKGHSPDPGIMKLLLQGGSLVNHQDKDGHTSLHVVTQQLHWGLHLYGSEQSDNDWIYNKRTDVLHSMRVLLNNEADPFLGDKCDCACSQGRSGCTPSHLALRGTFDSYLNNREGIWILEYVDIVREVKGHKAAEQCLLDVLRLAKFHELELTHTCHRHYGYNYLGERHIEEDEIKEIHDEEAELIDELEKEMQAIERTLPIDFDPELLGAIFQHSLTMKKSYTPLDISVSISHHYEIDSWRDEFVWQRPKAPPLDRVIKARESETVDTVTYAAWVEHEHLKHQKEGIVDTKWYEKRISWIATLRGINKTVKKVSKLVDVK